MGILSSIYPDVHAVEAALDRANQAEIDIISMQADIEELAETVANIEGFGLVVRNGMLCVVYESEG